MGYGRNEYLSSGTKGVLRGCRDGNPGLWTEAGTEALMEGGGFLVPGSLILGIWRFSPKHTLSSLSDLSHSGIP